MAVDMRVHCSVCNYTWDRSIRLDDDEIVCPACGNSQENFEERELAKIESQQRRQAFFGLIATACIVGGVGCLLIAALLTDPKAGIIAGDMSKIQNADLESQRLAAAAVASETTGTSAPKSVSEELVGQVKENARVLRRPDDIEKLADNIKDADKPNPELYKPVVISEPVQAFIYKKQGYTSLQVLMGIIGGGGLLAGLIIGFPAQGRRYVAEI